MHEKTGLEFELINVGVDSRSMLSFRRLLRGGDENGRAHDDGRADDGQCGWDRVEENPLEDRSEDDLDIDSQSPSPDGLALQTHGQQRLGNEAK